MMGRCHVLCSVVLMIPNDGVRFCVCVCVYVCVCLYNVYTCIFLGPAGLVGGRLAI